MELTKKQQLEQKIFRGFAPHCELNIDQGTITSCDEPQPDIHCMLEGREYFFELGEVVPNKHARDVNVEGRATYGIPDAQERGPKAMVRLIEKKQTRTYETGGVPVGLLLYFDKDFSWFLSDVPEDAIPPEILSAAYECKRLGPFTRIWAYCSWTNNVWLLA